MDSTFDIGDDWDAMLERGLRAAVPKNSDLASGSTLGPDSRYRIVREVGRGGMGVVYEAHDESLERVVAVKVLHDDFESLTERWIRFVEEAQIASQLQHPGIVPIHDLGRTPQGRPFLVMRLIGGETLGQRLADVATSSERLGLLPVFLQICQTMAYAHARGVIHRDLKPSNVLLGEFGEVQLTDWGLARLQRAEGQEGRPTNIRMLRQGLLGWESIEGEVVGTPAYMAPEQARGESSSLQPTVDVFALGAILCEILTGERLYNGATSEEVREQAAVANFEGALERLDAGPCDGELKALVRACLDPEPTQRLSDAGVVATAVADHLASLEQRLRRAELEAAEQVTRALHRRRVRRVTAGAALLVVAGVFAFDAYRRERTWTNTQAVEAEMNRAVVIRASAPLDSKGLAEALSIAEGAIRLARATHVLPETMARGRALVNELSAALAVEEQRDEQERADARIAARIDESFGLTSSSRSLEVDDAFGDAFAEYGIPVESLAAEEIARRVLRSRIPQTLINGLDRWAAIRRPNNKTNPRPVRPLLDALAQADPDPQRTSIRRMLLGVEPMAPENFVGSTDFSRAPRYFQTVVAEMLAQTGHRDAALKILRRNRDEAPGDFWVLMLLAFYNEDSPSGRMESVSAYEAALAVAPKSTTARQNLASLLLTMGNVERATYLAESLPRDGVDGARAHFLLARIEAAKGNETDELRELNASLAINPDFAGALTSLGSIHLRHGRLDEAQLAFERVLAKEPDDAACGVNRAVVLNRRMNYGAAEVQCHKVLERHPRNVPARVTLAGALEGAGETERAGVVLQEALELDPMSVEVHQRLARVLAKRGLIREAIQVSQRALSISPEHLQTMINLGQLLRLDNRPEEALPYLERAEERRTKETQALFPPGDPLAQCREDLANEAMIRRILVGQSAPDAATFRKLIAHCISRRAFAREALLWDRLLRGDDALPPELMSGAFPRAAASGIRAATGRASDAGLLDTADRSRCRLLALDSLGNMVEFWEKSESMEEGDRKVAINQIEGYLEDPEFASVRDPDALLRLPDVERQRWTALWVKLAQLQDRLDSN